LNNKRHLYSLVLIGLLGWTDSYAQSLGYGGRLVNANGIAITSNVDLQIDIIINNDDANPACSIDKTAIVPSSNGVFNVNIDYTNTCTGSLTLGETLNTAITNGDVMEVRITDETIIATPVVYPKQRILAGPLSILSHTSRSVIDESITDTSMKGVSSTCAVNQYLVTDGSGNFACQNIPTTSSFITGLTGGTGILISGSAPTLTVTADVGTSANKIVQLDGGGKIVETLLPNNIDATKIADGSVTSTEFEQLSDISTGSTIQAQINTKEPTIAFPNNTTTFWRGDKSFATLNTDAVAEATNLYFTDARAKAAAVSNTITNPRLQERWPVL
jgi:hypothetical protein